MCRFYSWNEGEKLCEESNLSLWEDHGWDDKYYVHHMHNHGPGDQGHLVFLGLNRDQHVSINHSMIFYKIISCNKL